MIYGLQSRAFRSIPARKGSHDAENSHQPDQGNRHVMLPIQGAAEMLLVCLPPPAESQDRAAHGLDRDGPCKDHQVAPAEGLAVLELDPLKENFGLVQVGIVAPRTLGVKALAAAVTSSAAIRSTVRASAMPCLGIKIRARLCISWSK